MPRSIKVDINPEVLGWARKTGGFNIEEIARKLRNDANIISLREKGKEKPTYAQLEKLAGYYKRPLAVFFLPSVPDLPAYPPGFRKFFRNSSDEFEPVTIFAIRRARWIQSKTKVEIFCNHFSGAFLVPKDALLSEKIVLNKTEYNDEDIIELSRIFSVSRHVIARRLLTFGKISGDFYREKTDQWLEEARGKGNNGGFVRYIDKAVNKNGINFSRYVLEALRQNKIQLGEVSDLLDIKIQHLKNYTDKIIQKGGTVI